MSEVRVKVKLAFAESEVRRAVLATLVRRFDVDADIRRADVEEHRGWIVCEVDGQSAPVDAALDWLRTRASPSTCSATSSRVEPCLGAGLGLGLSGRWGTVQPAEETFAGLVEARTRGAGEGERLVGVDLAALEPLAAGSSASRSGGNPR